MVIVAMSPVTVAVIPEGAPVSTLGALLGPLGALALAAGLVTVGVLVVGLVMARGRARTTNAPLQAPSTEPPVTIPHPLRPRDGAHLGEQPMRLPELASAAGLGRRRAP